MNGWSKLDLRRKDVGPKPGELVVLCLVSDNPHGFHKLYAAGQFKRLDSSRKLWFCRGDGGTLDPVRLKAKYTLWWHPLNAFNG